MSGDGGNNGQTQTQHRRKYLRSASWTDRSPTKPEPRHPPSSNRARAFLPPLSISRRTGEEWPCAGSDDLGVWPNVQTPRGGLVIKPPGELPPEFLVPRDKLAFYNKECSRIAEHVYLGSDAVAQNRELLRRNGITHVLNCVGFVSREYFKSDLVYKTLWLQDSPSEDITSILYDVFDYFEDVREQGGRVLVHCCQGVSRSTSLVIAYLMWREGQSFEDAFQYVKAARGVTNPNMGFACQLLQCQKRVHAVPASPRSLPRMYKMAPHSPYDPLHLVPKMLDHASSEMLDSRGAFVVHIPTALYVWVGTKCNRLMWRKAEEAARQVIRYEQAKGPIVAIKEGEEPVEFWDAFASVELSPNGSDPVDDGVHSTRFVRDDGGGVTERRVSAYNVDFEIYAKALSGGVVPPLSATCSDSETCLPARENGWDKLKQKFASGAMKEFIMTAKAKSDALKSSDTASIESDVYDGSDYPESVNVYPISPSTPSSYPCNSPDSFSYFLRGGLDTCYEDEDSAACTNPFPSPESFSRLPLSSPVRSSKSPTLSPSTSEYASSFTFSPSSSNWSDSSYFSSRQTIPSGATNDPFSVKRVPLLTSPCIPYKGRHSSPEVPLDAASDPELCKGPTSPSIKESSPVTKKLMQAQLVSMIGWRMHSRVWSRTFESSNTAVLLESGKSAELALTTWVLQRAWGSPSDATRMYAFVLT
ncbi:hypothetical protein MLD38_011897 [Melastoma candidum]|uniref:Uncharacterized protein n=2 Tax=Melastoma candidum TaxID=119954 RepID=A0ACB9R5M9_9MYRT|nr:hypothetical protein MLD38_011897 [Melastoma candidum]